MIAHELTAAAFERSPAGMLVVDRSGTILALNHQVESMLGYERDELVGKNVEVLVPQSRAAGHADLRASYMSDPSVRPMGAGRDLHARTRDGAELPVEIGLGPVEVDGQVLVLCTMVDISARRQVEKHLRQAQKLEAIGALAGGIAHDFNNVLQGILGYAELLRDAVQDLPEACADVDVIVQTAHRGRDLVNHILQFSRKDEQTRGRLRLEPSVHETINLLRATLRHDIEIRTHVDPQTPDVLMDATELNQVLMNLANNAAQAMEDTGGVIEVRTGPVLVDDVTNQDARVALPPGVYACLTVSDTGHGIPTTIAERIFEPFFTTKPAGKGTGLGLAMVQRIVRSLGGNVSVRSEIGSGTRFDIYLPGIAPSVRRTNPPPPAHTNRGRVLYVDDEERLAQLGHRVLSAAGFEVDAYSSSLQALADFRAAPERYDLVITDNNMPHLPGIQFASAITKVRPTIPILMVSGNSETHDPATLTDKGVRRLIQKPYSIEELKTAVAELIAASRAQR
jgi:two-component system cell cycle sensor histidine kinase/response regulator CckA